MSELRYDYKELNIRIFNDPQHTFGSADNVRQYDSEYCLSKDHFQSKHSIECHDTSDNIHSCIVAADGGATGIHCNSCLIVDNSLLLAIGDLVCRFSLPDLKLKWHTKVDRATCFGLHWSDIFDCIVVHGELGISRLELDGNLTWQSGGREIFTGEFRLQGEYAEVIDWDGDRYRFHIQSGKAELLQ